MRVFEIPLYRCLGCGETFYSELDKENNRVIFKHWTEANLGIKCPKENDTFSKSIADLSIEVL